MVPLLATAEVIVLMFAFGWSIWGNRAHLLAMGEITRKNGNVRRVWPGLVREWPPPLRWVKEWCSPCLAPSALRFLFLALHPSGVMYCFDELCADCKYLPVFGAAVS